MSVCFYCYQLRNIFSSTNKPGDQQYLINIDHISFIKNDKIPKKYIIITSGVKSNMLSTLLYVKNKKNNENTKLSFSQI